MFRAGVRLRAQMSIGSLSNTARQGMRSLWRPFSQSLIPCLLLSPLGIASSVKAEGLVDGSPPPLPTTVFETLKVPAPTGSLAPLNDLPPVKLSALSIEQAVQLSVDRNPKLKASYLTFRSSQDLVGAALAAWWPTLDLSVGTGPYKYNQNESGSDSTEAIFSSLFSGSSAFSSDFSSSNLQSVSGQPDGSYLYSTLTFSLTWDVVNPTRSLDIWKSKYESLRDADRYTITYRDLKLNVENAYVALQASNAQKLAYEAIVENALYLVNVTNDKQSFGVASGVDVAKQKTNYFSDLAQLQKSVRDIKVDQSNLAELLNVTNAEQISLSQALKPLGAWSYSLEETLEASIQYRKIVQEMLLDSYIQNVNSNIEMATYLPTLQLVAQLYGNQTGYWTESYSDFVKNPSAVLTFQWTGFDGGSARMRASSYQKLAESAYQTYLDTVNQVKKEARSGFYQVQKGKDIVLASADQVKQASKSLELQTARFQLGYGSVTDLVQAQQQMAQAVLDYVADLRQYNQDLLTLARNTGLEIDRGSLFLDAVGEPLVSLRRITRL